MHHLPSSPAIIACICHHPPSKRQVHICVSSYGRRSAEARLGCDGRHGWVGGTPWRHAHGLACTCTLWPSSQPCASLNCLMPSVCLLNSTVPLALHSQLTFSNGKGRRNVLSAAPQGTCRVSSVALPLHGFNALGFTGLLLLDETPLGCFQRIASSGCYVGVMLCMKTQRAALHVHKCKVANCCGCCHHVPPWLLLLTPCAQGCFPII